MKQLEIIHIKKRDRERAIYKYLKVSYVKHHVKMNITR